MRSRYAAYALGKVGYILKTERLAGEQKETVVRRRDIKQFSQNTQFAGLQILDAQMLDAAHATVTFHAILLQSGHDVSYTEKSLFEKINGRWLYVGAAEL